MAQQGSSVRGVGRVLLILLVIAWMVTTGFSPPGEHPLWSADGFGTRLTDLIGPVPAHAAVPPKVVCVPHLPTDLLVPHETWSDKATILKGIARPGDAALTGGSYYWDFGDGTTSSPQSITNPDNLAATHTYSAAPGTPIFANLYVTDSAGQTFDDEYLILIKDQTLEVEVNKAIDDALWWLYTHRETVTSGCRWNNVKDGNRYGNTTASAVQAFEINGHLESGDPDQDPYVDVVRGGLRYLLSTLSSTTLTVQTAGNPDSNGNSAGLQWPSDRPIYETGAVMDALVATGTPDAIAQVGGINVIGRTYRALVQDMVDQYAWGQVDAGNAKGGWRYSWNSEADNSASQWAAIGMIAAERHFGCTVPPWVKTLNNDFLKYTYNAAGYFGYTSTGAYRSGYATGPSGMVQMAFDGFTKTDSRWKSCENYLKTRWMSFIAVSNDNRYYSYYAFAKAMRLALHEEITDLCDSAGNCMDWYGDPQSGLARILVDRQLADGSWAYDGWPYVGERTAAAWNVIILTRTLFEQPPVAIARAAPNPGAIGQWIQFDGTRSYHVDPAKKILQYIWDFDAADGIDLDPNTADSTESAPQHAYSELGNYLVTLKVIDDSTPPRFATATLNIGITIPPHPPTAVIGGPYMGVVGEAIQVDGSGSYDIDAGQGDRITQWEWETNFIAPYDFAEASGAKAALPPYQDAGRHDLALRVTDDTAAVFPTSGQPNLSHSAYGEVWVFPVGVTNLAARPKATKCQLTWTHIGAPSYEILRSEKGPNHDFTLIGTTSSTYSSFIDYNVELYKDYWYRIRCRLNDQEMLSGPTYMKSSGRVTNKPPVITSTPVTTAVESVLYSYIVTATDPEGKPLQYYLDAPPAGMTIDAATGLIHWTPVQSQIGLQDVTVRVTDSGGMAAVQFFQIQVQPRPNSAPLVNPGGPYQGLTEQAVAFSGSATDPEGDAIVSIRWVFGDGTEAVGTSVVHTYNAAGTYTITLYATDDRGAVGQAETSCQIGEPNRPPVANPGGPYSGPVNQPLSLDASQSYDPDSDALTYQWQFGDGTSGNGRETVHTYTQEGTFLLTLTVEDGRGGSDSATTSVTITPPNQPPIAMFTVSGEWLKWQTLTFDGLQSYDPEGRPLTAYAWDFGDGSGHSTGALVSYAYAEPGTYVVTLTVTDAEGAQGSAQQTLVIAHPPNHDPFVDAGGPYHGAVNTNVTLTATGADPDGDWLTYTWTCDGTDYSGQTVDVAFTTLGSHTVTLNVIDGYGGSATDTAEVLVYDPNAPQIPPTVAITSPTAGALVNAMVPIIGTVTDDNLLNWRLELAPTGTDQWQPVASGTSQVIDGPLGTLDASLLPEDFYRLRLTASDGMQSSATWVEVQVNDPIKLGRFSLTYEDLSFPALGMTIRVNRSYDSIRKSAGDFGGGWTLDLKQADLREDASHNVFITLPDGRRVAFAFTPVLMSPWFPFYEARFTAPPGVYDQLDFVGNHMLVYSGGDWYFFMDSAGLFNPETYILKTKKGLTYTIGETLGVTRIEDRNGNYVEIVNDGTRDGIYTGSGRKVEFERDALGRVTAIKDAAGASLFTYSYDARGDLITATDGDLNATGYAYDDAHYLLQVIDSQGRTPLRNEYYPDGRLKAHVDGSGNRSTYSYDLDNRKETVTNALGGATTYSYNALGKVLEVLDPLGGVTQYHYDAAGNELRRRDPTGRTMESSYDGRGNQLTETRYADAGTPLTTTNTYGDLDLVTSVTRPGGDRILFAYDDDGNLLRKEKQAADGTTLIVEQWTYDGAGNRLTYRNGNGQVWTYQYNAFGDRIQEIDPLGVAVTYEYNALGEAVARIDGLGQRIDLSRNGRGLVTQVRQGSDVLYDIHYNDLGKPLQITDFYQQKSQFAYDAQGRPATVQDPLGKVTVYSHDAVGNLVRLLDARGNDTLYTYDAAARMVGRSGPPLESTDPNSRSPWAFDYDGDGYLISRTDPDGNPIGYTYDGLGRLEQITRPEGTISYSYDADSRVLGVQESQGGATETIGFSYNPIGWPQSVTDTAGRRIDYEHDGAGNRTRVSVPGQVSVQYQYDNAARLSRVELAGHWVAFGYDAAGRRISATRSNGVETTYGYDAMGRLASVITSKVGVEIDRYDYSIDKVGNRTGVTLNDGSVSWTYDAGNQLSGESIQSTSLGTLQQSFSYDAASNRLDSGVVIRSDNALLKDSNHSYGYDDNGNRHAVDSGTIGYHYDSENRLIGVTNGGTLVAEYAYDALGRRTRKTVSSGGSDVTTEYLYDNQDLLALYRNGTPVAWFIHSDRIDEPLMTLQNGTVYFYHADGLGNLVALSDAAGVVVHRYGYDAWGRIIHDLGSFSFDGATGLVNTFTFTGREYDAESGLYHYRSRAYDPETGRFLQRDGQQGRLLMPQTLNPYAYTLNHPVGYVDPSGQTVLIGYTAILVIPSGKEVAASLAGFLHGWGATNIAFLGSYMELIANRYDLQTTWDLAMIKTKAIMERTKSALGLAETVAGKAGDEAIGGIPGAFKSGATFQVGFKINIGAKLKAGKGAYELEFENDSVVEKEYTLEQTGGGFENGVAEAMSYLQQLRPR